MVFQPDHATKELKRIREREVELKRLNGVLACTECRRTRSACNKKVPCAACIDRGCPDICPLGTILNPRYEKPVLLEAAVLEKDDYDERIDRLQALHNRISALEDALQLLTGGRHDLLADSLLRVKRGDDVNDIPESRRNSNTKGLDSLVDSFGTLSVGNAAMHYIGPSSIEISLREERHAQRVSQQDWDFFESSLPEDLIQASSLFPFVPACFSGPFLHAKLIFHLPTYARATELIEAYFANLAWYTTCITREQVRDELLPVVYPNHQLLDPSSFREEQLHDLGLLFVLFAMGAVSESTEDSLSEEAEDFEKLARCALGLRDITEHGSLESCQAIVLLGSYEYLSDRKKSSQSSTSLTVWGLKLGLSIGLHLDPRRWNLEPRLAERRRWIFWQFNFLDKMRSSENRYPPVFEANAIDCEFPEDSLALELKTGGTVESIWRWRHRFVRDSLTPLCELLSDARPIRYTRILELGSRLEAQKTHPFAAMTPREQAAVIVEPAIFRQGREDGPGMTAPPAVSVWFKHLSIQHLHRTCFARAIIENPSNPYGSIYAPSFLATFRSTSILLKFVFSVYDHFNVAFRRLHKHWSVVAAGGIIVGTIACHVKVQPCRDEAHDLLEQLVALFESASELPIPGESLSILNDLLKRSKAEYKADSTPVSESTQLNCKISNIVQAQKDEDNELSMLSSHNARVISQTKADTSMPKLVYDSHPLPLDPFAKPDFTPSQDSKDPLVWLTDHEEEQGKYFNAEHPGSRWF